jgi:hypothetical protein
MTYQYVREPLTAEEADRLAKACETPTEQLIVWTLLDTGDHFTALQHAVRGFNPLPSMVAPRLCRTNSFVERSVAALHTSTFGLPGLVVTTMP